jgi:PAS domain S-box-containing protein
VLGIALLAAAYAVLGELGLAITAVAGFATPVWAPTGLSLAALVLFGYRCWPGVALGAFVVNLWAGAPASAALGVAAGNTLEAIAGAYALRRMRGFDPGLRRLRDVLALILVAAPLSTIVSATVGVSSLLLAGVITKAELFGTWRVWWVGNLVGDVVVAPFLMAAPGLREVVRDRGRLREGLLLVFLVAALGRIVFWMEPSSPLLLAFRPMSFFPLLIWAALRFGPSGAAAATVLASVLAIWGTAYGNGVFADGTLTERLTQLQSFMATIAGTTLVLAAITAERRKAEIALRKAHDDLEARVQHRTEELWTAVRELTREIGERQGVETQLLRREAQLCEAQEMAHLGSFEWDIPENRVSWSEELYRMHGFRSGERAATLPWCSERLHPDDRASVSGIVEDALRTARPFRYEARLLRADGAVRFVEAEGKVVADPAGRPVRMLGMCRDNTEQELAETRLRASLQEKEILLKEIHHRVKNNLQVVSSLLCLQAAHADEPGLREAMKESQARVRSIALVHERLYQARDLAQVPFPSYLRSLAAELLRTHGAMEFVRIDVADSDVSLPVDVAIPCALIVNELLTNALKHAFPAEQRGRIEVTLERDETGFISLAVADEGIGLPLGFDFRSSRTLGLRLVGMLVAQLGGTVEVQRIGGTRVCVRLPADPRPNPRS